MKIRNICLLVVLITITVLLGASCSGSQYISASVQPAANEAQPVGAVAQSDYKVLPKTGEKVKIDSDYYFTYGFTKPPKLGTSIMKVEIYTREGKRDTSFMVKGDVDMPSMRGTHSTGDKDFSISTKGDYLLPVPLVMPGEWEFRFNLVKNGKTVLRGAYLFDL